jgi:FtsP/CotA-like multicopper oxidase with cupredoxin domain
LSTTTGVAPAGFASLATCPDFQVPAPTLIVREGTTVTVNLINNLPAPAGNTSIVFPGFQVSVGNVTTVGAVTLNANIPTVAGPTYLASSDPSYANVSVAYGTGATGTGNLTPVATSPLAAGQYSVAGGTYTFSVADSGQPVVINGTISGTAPNPVTANAIIAAATPVTVPTNLPYIDGGVVGVIAGTNTPFTSTTAPVTLSGTYALTGSTYTFCDCDAGVAVTIIGTGTITTTTPVTPLTVSIPTVSNPTVAASAVAGYSNTNVVWGAGAVNTGTLTLSTTLPLTAGQYSVAGGSYTFSVADSGQPVVISGTAPATTATGANGLMTQEAAPGGTVTYTFTATKPGTYAYYSGTQPELQIEMGMYGAIIVLPNTAMDSFCAGSLRTGANQTYRLANAAYDHPQTCYDREYLFQFSEADSRIHRAAEEQVQVCAALGGVKCAPAVVVNTDPYSPNYFLVNGRSMPDLMDGSFIPNLPAQPYNGNPHIRPGELLLMRTIGQGRIQHPFHIHGDHARTLARDGNLLLAQVDPSPLVNPAGAPATVNRLAGPLIFTVPTVSGQSIDGIFSWSGKGLNWDVYGPTNHTCNGVSFPGYGTPPTPALPTPVAMDAAGYQAYLNSVSAITATTVSAGYDSVTGENCADHGKPIPVMPPDPQIVANGLWYSGTPYLGVQTIGSAFASTPLPPGTALQNTSAGYAYMWHSHDEREITTNDVFPGGMMMMLIIDPPGAAVDETK